MPLFWPLNLLTPSWNNIPSLLQSPTQPSTSTTELADSPQPNFLRRFFTRIWAAGATPTTDTSAQSTGRDRQLVQPRSGTQRGSTNGVTENTPLNQTNGSDRSTNGTEATESRAGAATGGHSLSATAQPGTTGTIDNTTTITQNTTGEPSSTYTAENSTNSVFTSSSGTHSNQPRLPASWSFRSLTSTTGAPHGLRRSSSFLSMTTARTTPRTTTIDDDTLLEQQLHRYAQAQNAIAQALEDLEAVTQERDSLATLADNRRKECDAVRLLYIAAEAKAAELSTEYDILDNSYASVKGKYQHTLWERDDWEAEESDATIREQVEVQGEQLRGVAVMLQGVERMLDEWITPGLAVRDPTWYTSPDGSMFVVLLQRIRKTRQELAAGEAANWPASGFSSDQSKDDLQGAHDLSV